MRNKLVEQDEQLEALRKELKLYKLKTENTKSDNETTIKRYIKEKEQTSSFAISKIAKDVLEVIDNIERGN